MNSNAQLPPTPPTQVKNANFQCDIVLEIYDGFYDWVAGKSYSGSGHTLDDVKKLYPGAVTLANLNDTNGNGVMDIDDYSVQATSIGRNEVDLMKLVVKQRDGVTGTTGNVILEKVSGAVKLWTQPYKGTMVNISGPISIPVAALPKTYYIEATAKSASLMDIEFKATFNSKVDRVKATAVWVEGPTYWSDNSSTPAISSLPNLGPLVKIQIQNDIAEDGTLFGHGDFWTAPVPADNDYSTKNKRFGGRILMEWQVFPIDAGQLVSFDVTRQRKSISWFTKYLDLEFSDSDENKEFPFEEGKDVEEPNDDGKGIEDRDPMNGFLYSWDAPFVAKKKLPVDEYKAFHVSKNSFKEFVRARTKSNPFDLIDESLQGSRASDKFDWHCVYYARKDEDYKLSKDALSKSHCHPISKQLDVNSIFMTVIKVDGNVTYELGPFTIFYYGIEDGNKSLSIFRKTGVEPEPQPQFYTIPSGENVWNLNLDGVTMTLTEINAIPDNTFINFSVFQTGASAKDNIIGPNEYTDFTR